MRALPSLVDISIPDDRHFTVCGDVHGQFYDLLNIWELNGLPAPDNPYLFNGRHSTTALDGVVDDIDNVDDIDDVDDAYMLT